MTNRDLVHGGDDIARLEQSMSVVPDRLSNLELAERVEIDFWGVFALAAERRKTIFNNPFKSAIVAGDLVRYGCARMFQTLNDHPQITIAIFPEVAQALEWLAEKESPA